MQHGLMVGAWMSSATLAGFWLWYSGKIKQIRTTPIVLLLTVLLITTVLCKSTGALLLMVGGGAALYLSALLRTKLILWGLVALAPCYLVARTAGLWDGSDVVETLSQYSEDRAQSLGFRIKHENMLIERAWERPVFGWGGWGRNRVHDEEGNDISVTDGLWIIQLGTYGIVGLASLYAVMLLPLALLLLRYSTRSLLCPEMAAPLALGVLVTLFAIDGIPNAMVNPVFILTMGGLAGMSKQLTMPSQTEMKPTEENIVGLNHRSLHSGHPV
jgi:hypothetical protein